MKKEMTKKKKTIRNIIIAVLVVILVPLLIVIGYLLYVILSYHRIGNVELDVKDGAKNQVLEKEKELSLTSYNIGFGAYSDDYTFFMDTGIDKDGNKTQGEHGKAISLDAVKKNTEGSLKTIESQSSDFIALQEVDLDSDRSYHFDQQAYFEDNLNGYDSTFAIDFDSAYLFYPFHDPHGKSKSGLSTLSRYDIRKADRKEYTIATGFSKYMDLDRCFSVNRMEVDGGKEFVLINSHMSAYDEGGLIRDRQMKELYSFMKEEYDKGNYVLTAGDFNHDLLTNNPLYPQYTRENYPFKEQIDQGYPDWVSFFYDEKGESSFNDGFTVYAADNEPSCRDADVVYQKGSTFVSTLDGFILSDNIKAISVNTSKTGENGFAYSDHQPTTLRFMLK